VKGQTLELGLARRSRDDFHSKFNTWSEADLLDASSSVAPGLRCPSRCFTNPGLRHWTGRLPLGGRLVPRSIQQLCMRESFCLVARFINVRPLRQENDSLSVPQPMERRSKGRHWTCRHKALMPTARRVKPLSCTISPSIAFTPNLASSASLVELPKMWYICLNVRPFVSWTKKKVHTNDSTQKTANET
jgi:hypothetical protein